MDPFTISLGVSALGAGLSYFNRLGQADAMRRQTEEQVRRFKAEAAQRVGAATAAGAASGIEMESSSLQNYLTQMTAEFKRQADWMRAAGTDAASAQGSAAGWGLFGDLGSAITQYGRDENWWKKPALAPGKE